MSPAAHVVPRSAAREGWHDLNDRALVYGDLRVRWQAFPVDDDGAHLDDAAEAFPVPVGDRSDRFAQPGRLDDVLGTPSRFTGRTPVTHADLHRPILHCACANAGRPRLLRGRA